MGAAGTRVVPSAPQSGASLCPSIASTHEGFREASTAFEEFAMKGPDKRWFFGKPNCYLSQLPVAWAGGSETDISNRPVFYEVKGVAHLPTRLGWVCVFTIPAREKAKKHRKKWKSVRGAYGQ